MLVEIKWKFKGIKDVVIASDKRMYQLPYMTNKHTYPSREIKPHAHNGSIYYRIKGKRYSQKKLRDLIYQSNDLCELTLSNDELPF